MVPVNLTFDGLSEDDEENPGGFLCLNDDDDDGAGTPDREDLGATAGENDLRPLGLSAPLASEGMVTLSFPAAVRLYRQSNRTGAVASGACWATPGFPGCESLASMPPLLHVERYNQSGAARDVSIKLRYDKDGASCEDVVKLTVMRVDLELDANNDGVIDSTDGRAGTDDPIEAVGFGKIVCIDPAFVIPVNIVVRPNVTSGVAVLDRIGAGAVDLYLDPGMTSPVILGQPMPISQLPPTVFMAPRAAGETTIVLRSDCGGVACEDRGVVTVRLKFTSEAFPGMAFSPTNFIPQVDASAPRVGISPCPGTCRVGFGNEPPVAVAWSPAVDVQANDSHIACDQFTVGVLQTMTHWFGIYSYTDGMFWISGTTPTLDQHPSPGPGAFYSADSSHVLQACGTTGALAFVDTPVIWSGWTNSCAGKSGDLLSIEFDDQLETWLVALHNPSNCYTVIKHFTWTQSATTTSVNTSSHTLQATTSTSVSSVDSGPGGIPALIPPVFNNTITTQCSP